MRKFFNMIIAALVIMGAAACTNSDYITEVNTPAEGISFYADAAMTRVDLAYDEDAKVWNSVWEGNETLVVVDTQAQTSYEFTNTEAQPNLFSCTTAGAEELEKKRMKKNYNFKISSLVIILFFEWISKIMPENSLSFFASSLNSSTDTSQGL